MSKEIKKYTKIIYLLAFILSIILIPTKGAHLLKILLATGCSLKAGEIMIAYTKNYLKKQKYFKNRKQVTKDVTIKEAKKEENSQERQSTISKQNKIEMDEYIPLKEAQLEELTAHLSKDTQLDVHSITKMIDLVEKKIVTNQNSKDLTILKKQLIQFQFQLYDLVMKSHSNNTVTPFPETTAINTCAKRYTKAL